MIIFYILSERNLAKNLSNHKKIRERNLKLICPPQASRQQAKKNWKGKKRKMGRER
jgi:hypothetical protein